MVDQKQAVDLRDIRVFGLIGKRVDLTWGKNILALDWEKDFLAPFTEKKSEPGFYVGLGKTLGGLTRFAAYAGDASLTALRRRVMDTLAGAQLADGYMGCYRPDSRITRLWDVHEQAYLLLALVADWRYFHEQRSLRMACKLGDYLLANLPAGGDLAIEKSSHCVELMTIGLDRAMLALYQATQDRRYLDFCVNVQNLVDWNLDIVEGRHGKIEGHVYAYLTRCLAQIELFNISGNEKLLSQTKRALDYLLAKGGLVITGSCGQTECWHSNQAGAGDLGETCATAYLIRLCDKLLRLEGKGIYGDLMERAIYNALFSAQSPAGRQLRYYVPFEGKRVYWDRDTYCCPGNFRRIVSQLPEMIYYIQRNGLTINLYTSSRLKTRLTSGLPLEVSQETDYPNSGNITLRLNPAKAEKFAVDLRIPAWCKNFKTKVNEKSVPAGVGASFLHLEREWKTGDTISVEMDMPWRLIRGFAGQVNRVAIMRGPMLFCLNPKINKNTIGADLKKITIDPSTLQAPVNDQTVRADGLACRLKAWRDLANAGRPHDFDLVLTEFSDPDGEAAYFQASDLQAGVNDELLES